MKMSKIYSTHGIFLHIDVSLQKGISNSFGTKDLKSQWLFQYWVALREETSIYKQTM